MATAKRKRPSWSVIFLAAGALLALAWWFYGEKARAYGTAGTAYAAHGACACRHISGRALDACEADLLSSLRFVWLSEDISERTVTARIPLLTSTTATYRPGFGCVLEALGDE